MSKNWGRTPITNADKRHATQATYFVETEEGPEERLDRRPQGKAERFVDKDGNIVSIAMYGEGDGRKHETEQRVRAQQHAKGFVEHAKCPIKHGTRYSSDTARKDFAKMPAHLQTECLTDPKVMERKDGDLWAREGCKHIEWLIKHRRTESAKAYAKRNPHIAAMNAAKEREEELRALQLKKLADDLGVDVAPAVEQTLARRTRKPKAKEATPE